MRFFSIFILTTLFFSCSKNKIPDGILKPEKMQAVYWDILQADIFTDEYIVKDTSKNLKTENIALQARIFKKHGIDRQQFYRSYEYYLDHTDLMKDMIDTMMVRQKTNPVNIHKPAISGNQQ